MVSAPDLGQADVTDVSGLDHLLDRADGVLDGDLRVDPARTVDVDVVGSQPPQGVGQAVLDRRRADVGAGMGPSSGRVALCAELHADHDVLAGALLERPVDEELVVAGTVEVGRVDQVHPGVDGGVDRGDALGLVRRAVQVGHPHGTETDHGDGGAGPAECASLHCSSSSFRAPTSRRHIPNMPPLPIR